MQKHPDEALALLLAHMEELCERAVRGRFAHSAFLTPREAKHTQLMLRRRGQWHRARLWGGYDSAERVCLLLFPDYVVDMVDDELFHDIPVETLLTMADEEDPIVPLDVRGSGYRNLSHRDFLGSLLALGLERTVLGDIAMNEGGATVFCSSHIAPFLLSSVERIANDVVRGRVERAQIFGDFFALDDLAPLLDRFIGTPFERDALLAKITEPLIRQALPFLSPRDFVDLAMNAAPARSPEPSRDAS